MVTTMAESNAGDKKGGKCLGRGNHLGSIEYDGKSWEIFGNGMMSRNRPW